MRRFQKKVGDMTLQADANWSSSGNYTNTASGGGGNSWDASQQHGAQISRWLRCRLVGPNCMGGGGGGVKGTVEATGFRSASRYLGEHCDSVAF